MSTDFINRGTDPTAQHAETTKPPPGTRGSDYAALSREVSSAGC